MKYVYLSAMSIGVLAIASCGSKKSTGQGQTSKALVSGSSQSLEEAPVSFDDFCKTLKAVHKDVSEGGLSEKSAYSISINSGTSDKPLTRVFYGTLWSDVNCDSSSDSVVLSYVQTDQFLEKATKKLYQLSYEGTMTFKRKDESGMAELLQGKRSAVIDTVSEKFPEYKLSQPVGDAQMVRVSKDEVSWEKYVVADDRNSDNKSCARDGGESYACFIYLTTKVSVTPTAITQSSNTFSQEVGSGGQLGDPIVVEKYESSLSRTASKL